MVGGGGMLVDYASKTASSEKWVSGPWDKGLVEVAIFGAGWPPKIVNIFLKYFFTQGLWSRVVAFACLRVLARGGFGAVVGREKKAL